MPRTSVVPLSVNLSPPETDSSRGETVHIWRGSLDVDENELARLTKFLDAGELKRAARFRFERHRSRFIAGRGLLRSILGERLECEPSEIEFEYSSFGKPHLKDSALCFNLAHAEDRFVLAVCERAVGVDIELRRSVPDLNGVVAQVFSAAELQLWKSNPTNEKFLSLWTRKEALLKGIGAGIAEHLRNVSVFFENDSEIHMPDILDSKDWAVRTMIGEDEIWSLAIQFRNPQLCLRFVSARAALGSADVPVRTG